MNEPTFPEPGGALRGGDAEAFASDDKDFEQFLRNELSSTIFLGLGSICELHIGTEWKLRVNDRPSLQRGIKLARLMFGI